MSNLTTNDFQQVAGRNFFTFANRTPEEMAPKLLALHQQQGYRLEVGDTYLGLYGIGNRVLRILFGAFVRRFLFEFSIHSSGNDTVIEYKDCLPDKITLAKRNREFARMSNLIRGL